MEGLFLKVLSMSATAAVVILLVLLARLPLRKAPKVFSHALWAVVLFRLLCPFSFESAFSVLPAVQSQPTADGQRVAYVYTGVAVVNNPVNDYLSGHPYPADLLEVPAPGADTAKGSAAVDWMTAAAGVWLAGAAILLGYSLISLLILRRRLVGSVPLEGEKNVRLADHIPSPFVLGLFQPKIYLPSGLPEGERDYILLHERTHIRRFDHVFRALAWLALAIHWFNPLVWLAFRLAGKDMEMSCDEEVLRKMGRDVRADYSSSLLRLSTGKRLPAGPLAFGDGDPTSRIKNVLSYKKPALWVIVIALIGVVCAGVALATDRGRDPDDGTELAFTLMQLDAGRPYVHMSGTVLGHTVEDTTWWPPYGSGEDLYVGYRGLMMEYTFEGKGNQAFAWWADESRTSVTVSTEASVMAVSMPLDWWEFTVDLSGRQGVVTSMETKGRRGMLSDPLMTIPEAISDEEAVEVARIAAKLMTAAEDWYLQQPVLSTDLAANLTFSLDETDGELGPVVRMDGTVGDVTLPRGAFWYPNGLWKEQQPGGELSMVYPAFTDGIEGHVTAWWADESRTSVTLSTHMMAMLSSYLPTGYWIVTVNLDNGTLTELTQSNLTTVVGNEDAEVRLYPSSISVKKAAEAARVAAKLMTAAEDWYLQQKAQANGSSENMPGVSQPERVWSWGSSGDMPDKVNWDMEEWARNYGISYRYSQRDIDDAIAAARTYLEEWGQGEHVISFEIADVYEARLSTLHQWFMYFDRTSSFFTDWTQEDMETRYIVIGADYTGEYDHTLTPLGDGQQQIMMALTRPAGGKWSVYSTGSALGWERPGYWMEVWTATPTWLECFIENATGKALTFGNDYRLQVEEGGVWRDVEEENPMDFLMLCHVLDGSESRILSISFPVDCGSRYGELPPGHYRILKEAALGPEGEWEAVTLSAEFDIKV